MGCIYAIEIVIIDDYLLHLITTLAKATIDKMKTWKSDNVWFIQLYNTKTCEWYCIDIVRHHNGTPSHIENVVMISQYVDMRIKGLKTSS